MDSTERKALELMRVRKNRVCETCANNSAVGCEVTPDKKACVYNDYELWKPNSETFLVLAERVLAERR